MKRNEKVGILKRMLVTVATVAVCGLSGMAAASAQAAGNDVIQNGSFDSSDTSMWTAASGGATVEQMPDTVVIGDVEMHYGVIKGRTSAYECIAQDITASVKKGTEYEYSFWCMLSQDYAGAPADQRVVEFAPYMTVDGTTTYMGTWSGEVTGNASQSLTPGEWTKFSGTFQVDYSGNLEQMVIRLLEQGTNYGQGECVKGDYYITGVSLKAKEAKSLELEDVPILKDVIAQELGDEDFIVGGAVAGNEVRDKGVMAILEKHFNAVTIGNELKPDALFGYSNGRCPGTEEATLNGKTIIVPKMDYSRAEKILDVIYDWNQANPDNQIKVRGHVLVWHAQTPEWFFHVDYDKSKDYATPEEMNVRLEWFIKTVLEHFTGEDSKYKGMFYGWDVVNEAISDGTHTYRSDKENASEPLSQDTHGSNSSWWHVYQSNEFIINAFKYANKYAPADVKLFYNDYNEFVLGKANGIAELLKAVKEAEGTRIDGMGMQAHYSTSDPGITNFKVALKKYAEIVDEVQLTEWDLKSSTAYKGTEESMRDINEKIGYRYLNLYNTIKELKSEGYNISGFTFWGNIDKYSWLQSKSNVGGGMTTSSRQFPLLFDDDYNVKPAYWAFVDPTKIKTQKEEAKEESVVEESSAEESKEPVKESSAEESKDDKLAEESTESGLAVDDESADVSTEKVTGPRTVFLGAFGVALAVIVVAAVVVVVIKKKKSK